MLFNISVFQVGIIVALGYLVNILFQPVVGHYSEGRDPGRLLAIGISVITVFLANSEMLSVGLSLVLVGAVIMIGGSITNYLARLGDELKASISPTRLCPKCGAQVAGASKFCQSCGNKLGE